MATPTPPWPPAVVQAVSDVLGATDWPGLTGSEIGGLLTQLNIIDVEPMATKRHRLGSALLGRQAQDGSSHRLITFVSRAMAPARYLRDRPRFSALHHELGEVLSLVGLRVNDEGQVARARQAHNLDEVAQLAGRLRGELARRNVHAQVMFYCEEELLRQSIFHAVFEATKGLAARLRQLSGSTLDGSELVDACFGSKQRAPIIMINDYENKSEISEHSGFANLLRGVFGTFRNPVAHAPRTAWSVTEADALDLFSTLSFLHRRLDIATTAC